MALDLTRSNVLARFGGYRGTASSLVHGAGRMIRNELHPAVRTGAISLTSFAFGVIQGRYQPSGGAVWGGVPVDLLAAAAFHTVALFGFARNYAPLLQTVGDGALATFLTISGYRVGERTRSGTKGFIPAVLGAFVGEDKPVSGGSSIADEELRKLARG